MDARSTIEVFELPFIHARPDFLLANARVPQSLQIADRTTRTPDILSATRTDPAVTILRHWLEAVPNDRLAHLVRDATRAFARALQVRLNAQNVSFGHWTFLRVLWERDGLTQRELSEEVGVMEPTTYAAVRAMEQLGYVVREQRHGNRKNVHVRLTPRGRALKRKLVPMAVEVNRIGVAGIDPADVVRTREVLIAIIANLVRDELALSEPPRRSQARRKAG